MALNASTLGSELEQAVRTSQGLDGTPYPQLTAYCNAIAQAIVDHFVANAELNNVVVTADTTSVDGSGPGNHEHDVENAVVTGGIL